MVQEDVKKLVAYSSVAHLGFVMLGLFAFNDQGITGGMLQMLNHGVSTGALFLIVGFIYERRHTRLITDFGGLSKQMPIFATIFMIVTFSSIGLPGTNGFVGEFLVLLGSFESEVRWYSIVASSGVILSAVYMLWMFQRVMFGELDNPKNQKLLDLNAREIGIMLPLLVLIFVMGLYPNPFIEKMDPAIKKLVAQTKRASMTAQIPAALPAGHPVVSTEQSPEAVQTAPAAVPAPASQINQQEVK
jgi:NADH-quinone oxidoreductase subunit M